MRLIKYGWGTRFIALTNTVYKQWHTVFTNESINISCVFVIVFTSNLVPGRYNYVTHSQMRSLQTLSPSPDFYSHCPPTKFVLIRINCIYYLRKVSNSIYIFQYIGIYIQYIEYIFQYIEYILQFIEYIYSIYWNIYSNILNIY